MSFDGSPRTTTGALYACGMVSVGLSAVLGVQTFLHFILCQQDSKGLKLFVAWVWTSDAAHTISIALAIWQYAVLSFSLLKISPALIGALTLTAISILTANMDGEQSEIETCNWVDDVVDVPDNHGNVQVTFNRPHMIILICILWDSERLWRQYESTIRAALIISALTEIAIVSSRYFYLRELKQEYVGIPEMSNAVVIFTINDGLLTCGVIVALIICFVTMPHNYIWIGIYLTLSKLYSNSILATTCKIGTVTGSGSEIDESSESTLGAQSSWKSPQQRWRARRVGGRLRSSSPYT
ncbi:hypothetical protein C8F01DRAFT_1260385 [Mycena amicta]|nr:hypothetical protein C8F01DRAFT_1260385 [Mycena amicta]